MENEIIVPEILLNSGHKMPTLGLGNGSPPYPPPDQLTSILVGAIAAGYRHFDTASAYGTEEACGRAVEAALQSGMIKKREDIFVTSKLHIRDAHRDLVVPALKETIRELGLEYVDLYLIHWPIRVKQTSNNNNKINLKVSGKEDMLHFDIKGVWEGMEECSKLGLAKSIGVSNFSCAKLTQIFDFANIPPAVNQVEMNVAWQQHKMLKFCKEKNIHVCAWSPLGANGAFWGSNAVMESPVLKQIADTMNKSIAQVALRWIYEQGASPIVKSYNKERMKENMQIFDWELSDEHVCEIQGIHQAKGFNGEMFIFPEGQYKTLEELWDGEI